MRRPVFQISKAISLVLMLAAFFAGRAYAATDWSAIQTAMKTTGVVLPGDVLRFEIVRNIHPIDINGQVINMFEGASGFVSYKEIEDGRFFADGSIAVLDSESQSLQTALRQDPRIHITAIANRLSQETPSLLWIHFEARGNGASLATSIAAALATLGDNPQLGFPIIPGTENIISIDDIPPQFQELFKQGFLEQIGNCIVFYLPRPDEKFIHLGQVPASIGLGVGHSFYILIQGNVDSEEVTMDVDMALRKDDVQQVLDVLRGGGFSVSALSNNFTDDDPSLYFVHVYGAGNGFDFAQPLFTAVQIIEANAKHDHDHDHDHGW